MSTTLTNKVKVTLAKQIQDALSLTPVAERGATPHGGQLGAHGQDLGSVII